MNGWMRVLSSAKTARSLDENRCTRPFRARGVGSFPPSPATVDVAHCRRRLRSRRAQRTAVPRRVFRKYHMGIQ